VLQPKIEGVGICWSVVAHHVIEAWAETAPAFVAAVFRPPSIIAVRHRWRTKVRR
jgi:hypothetical protein